MTPRLPDAARSAVLAWYEAEGRSIAFRTTRDPYAILVSEVMAQQTQMSRVVPAWHRFLARFPTIDALAAASPADVIRMWQGMGYDRRALNLRRAAIAMRDRHGSGVPASVAELEQLPGIGPYTARAVAAIAFGAPVGAVDTNVRRVLRRALALGESGVPGAASAGSLQETADACVDPTRPADWTHAVMDIGATLCRPRTPRCAACPLREWCAARSTVADADAAPRPGPRPGSRPRPTAPFSSTTRWLRGRIVDRLRAAADDGWTALDVPIGSHDVVAVRRAVAALAADGLVEIHPHDPDRARLTTT